MIVWHALMMSLALHRRLLVRSSEGRQIGTILARLCPLWLAGAPAHDLPGTFDILERRRGGAVGIPRRVLENGPAIGTTRHWVGQLRLECDADGAAQCDGAATRKMSGVDVQRRLASHPAAVEHLHHHRVSLAVGTDELLIFRLGATPLP